MARIERGVKIGMSIALLSTPLWAPSESKEMTASLNSTSSTKPAVSGEIKEPHPMDYVLKGISAAQEQLTRAKPVNVETTLCVGSEIPLPEGGRGLLVMQSPIVSTDPSTQKSTYITFNKHGDQPGMTGLAVSGFAYHDEKGENLFPTKTITQASFSSLPRGEMKIEARKEGDAWVFFNPDIGFYVMQQTVVPGATIDDLENICRQFKPYERMSRVDTPPKTA